MKHLRLLFILLLLLGSDDRLNGQTVILDVDREDEIEDDEVEKFGPNRKHYIHLYLSLGMIIPEQDFIKFGSSMDFTMGIRYKYQLTEWLAVGTGLAYNSLDYHLKQDPAPSFPDTLTHKKEKFTFFNLTGEGYLRLNFGERGNVIGKYIDLGAAYNWAFDHEYFTEDDLPDGQQVEVKTRKLNYINRWFAHSFIRLGYNQYSLYGKYRLNSLIDPQKGDLTLPALSVGLQLKI